ncbi:hypothetical protein J6590_048965 [Homalodisca vitripennis]|nr:hypothetical protein J6590_048965 [Homalodisca vitripennis]
MRLKEQSLLPYVGDFNAYSIIFFRDYRTSPAVTNRYCTMTMGQQPADVCDPVTAPHYKDNLLLTVVAGRPYVNSSVWCSCTVHTTAAGRPNAAGDHPNAAVTPPPSYHSLSPL